MGESYESKCLRREEQWGDDGPLTASAAQQWIAQLFSRVSGPERSALKRLLRASLGFNTAYSGIGFFESIIYELSTYLGIPAVPCTHAFEIHSATRKALLGSDLPDGPEHVFGDLLSIYSTRLCKKMRTVQRRLAKEHRAMVAANQALCTFSFCMMYSCDMSCEAYMMHMSVCCFSGLTCSWCPR